MADGAGLCSFAHMPGGAADASLPPSFSLLPPPPHGFLQEILVSLASLGERS